MANQVAHKNNKSCLALMKPAQRGLETDTELGLPELI